MVKYMILLFLCLSCFYVNAQISEAPQNTRYYYNGQIQGLDHIQMNLHIDSYEVTGAFLLESSGEHYFIKGRLSGDKKGIGLRVYDVHKKYVASIEVTIISEVENFCKQLIGVYKPAALTSPRNISLRKIAEFANKDQIYLISNVSIP